MGKEKKYYLIKDDENGSLDQLDHQDRRQQPSIENIESFPIEDIKSIPQVIVKSQDIEEDNQDILFPTQKRVFNDKKFAIAFIIQMVIFLIMTFFAIVVGSKQEESKYVSFIKEFSIPFLGFHLISMVLLFIGFTIWERLLFRKNPMKTVELSFYGMIIVGLPASIILFYYKYYSTSIIWIISIVLLGFLYNKIKEKVPFIIEIILIVLDIMEKYRSIIIINFLSIFIFALYFCIWMFPMGYFLILLEINLILKIIITIILVFNLYWVFNFISFTCSTTISGLISTWYFFSDENFNGIPSNPIIGSLYRTTTTSFGSIAFGSLIVTIIDLLRSLLSKIANSSDSSILKSICLMCSISTAFIRGILYRFNLFTFSMISIYGQSFMESAKKTTNLLNVHNHKLFTSCALLKVIFFAISIIVSLSVTFLSLLIIYLIQLSIGVESSHMFVSGDKFVLVFFIFDKPFNAIYISAITILMCMCSDPNVFQQNKPNLYNKLNSLWNII
ncbi:hypothetical protein ACTFIU_005256 [Dictyostelium citrinum]